MKKLVPNPDYQNATYKVDFIWLGKPPEFTLPDIRTNNPNFMVDREGEIPSRIEVEVESH